MKTYTINKEWQMADQKSSGGHFESMWLKNHFVSLVVVVVIVVVVVTGLFFNEWDGQGDFMVSRTSCFEAGLGFYWKLKIIVGWCCLIGWNVDEIYCLKYDELGAVSKKNMNFHLLLNDPSIKGGIDLGIHHADFLTRNPSKTCSWRVGQI